jgi:tRNA dimethylallyltransferase
MAKLPDPEVVDPAALARAYYAGDIDLICVVGPTASGKTRYAVQLAHKMRFSHPFGVRNDSVIPSEASVSPEIISADSRQVYTGMDIGTGKDLNEYGDVPYHLIDIVPAGSKFNIYQYQEAFAKVYANIRSRGVIPILCGGSGLYIESVTRAYKFDKQNGLPDEALPQNPYYIGTLVTREERVARIDRRLEERLQEGLVEEIRTLLQTIRPEDLLYYGLEYKFVTQYVLGELSYEDMVVALGNAIHQFAKRQMTWFRGMERDGVQIHWVRP